MTDRILTEEMISKLITLEDFEYIHSKITDDLILYRIDLNNWDSDEEGNHKDVIIELTFSFYNYSYSVWISQKYLDKDYLTVQAEGNSILFDSFINTIENTHEELVLTLCKQYLKVLNNDNN